ncbi:MAG TPA: hypothetical protein VLS25_02765, partial [Dehalococcoidia bacterium]|nr:hypothetical protein [Dehalococcoidia bacterium]
MEGEPDQQGKEVPEDLLPADAPHPSVILLQYRSPELQVEPLGKTWASFFPDVRREEAENHHYPMPFTDEFWLQYGEPVHEFYNAATAFRDAISGLARLAPLDSLCDEDAVLIRRSLHTLEAMTSSVGLGLTVRADGAAKTAWVSKSLLSSLAFMAMEDIGQGVRALHCLVCRRMFVS